MATRKRTALTADDITKTTNRGGSVVRGLQARGAEVQMIDPRSIAANPFNPPERSVPDENLAQSIAEMGVLQPMLVAPLSVWVEEHGDDFPHPDGTEWVALDGHRRHAAALQADLSEVPVIERRDLVDKIDEVILAANTNRLALTPYEEAMGFKRLIEKGMKQAQIASVQGVAQGHVSKRLSLLKLPTVLAAAVTSRGSFSLGKALELLEDCSADVLQELAEQFVPPVEGEWETRIDQQTRRARDAVRQRAAEVEARSLAEKHQVDITDDQRLRQSYWDYEISTEEAVAKAKEDGTLRVAVIGGSARLMSTVKTRQQSGNLATEADSEARKSKKRRGEFIMRQLEAKAIPFQGSQENLIKRALGGRGTDHQVVTVAARFATAAGLIKAEDEWAKHGDLPKMSLATAIKFEYLLSLAETHQWRNYAYMSFDADTLQLYALIEELGYEPSEWEKKKKAEALKRAAREASDQMEDNS